MGKSFFIIDLTKGPMNLRRYGLENAKVGERYAFEVDEVENKFISFKLVKVDE